MSNESIIWPPEADPSRCPVFVRNEIQIQASPEKVWFWLTYAATWPEWYLNASKIRLIDQQSDHLQANTRFTWKTFDVNLKSAVEEFVPNERLAWSAKGIGIAAYHAWLIVPTADGCTVITEETQRGWVCVLGKWLMPNRMYRWHQTWLEGLKRKAEGNANPTSTTP